MVKMFACKSDLRVQFLAQPQISCWILNKLFNMCFQNICVNASVLSSVLFISYMSLWGREYISVYVGTCLVQWSPQNQSRPIGTAVMQK